VEAAFDAFHGNPGEQSGLENGTLLMKATDPIRIEATEVRDDRFSRFRLLSWWRQERIASARVLVVGAGALGNEIIKNLALLGFRDVVVADLDAIEASNLSRGVLFRPEDVGRPKAEVAADAMRALYASARPRALRMNVVQQLGLGVFGWADVILGGLDNREARLFLNRAAWKMGKPWIDGAIEGLNGVARVFEAGKPPCYECTLGETDWALLNRRMSCNLLTAAEEEAGKVATTPTVSSVIAGVQVQEALKLLHGLPTLSGKAFVFEGLHHSSYVTTYTEDPDCQSHYTLPEIIRLPATSAELTLRDLHGRASRYLGSNDVTIEFSRDVIWKLVNPHSGTEQEYFAPLGSLSLEDGADSADGSMRHVVTCHAFHGTEAYGDRRLCEMGLPLFDVFVARSGLREVAYLLEGDAAEVLGDLAGGAA
jgi:molybdopterin/thiamine biosynthesis adenylyltransferase